MSYSYSCGELVESYLLESVHSKKNHITVLIDCTVLNMHFCFLSAMHICLDDVIGWVETLPIPVLERPSVV